MKKSSSSGLSCKETLLTVFGKAGKVLIYASYLRIVDIFLAIFNQAFLERRRKEDTHAEIKG